MATIVKKTVKPESKAKVSFWNEKRSERLRSLYQKYDGKQVENVYQKIANQFKTKEYSPSANAVYKKIGRMGLLKANWVKTEQKRS